ncbi:chemotaxis signal transduction protein [Leptolyngbyaceae cyanobacterium JSC-12]|nr:chemotaxis signal transduction protein [Leptolyngbyaceae cyanobacterium JSC-12]
MSNPLPILNPESSSGQMQTLASVPFQSNKEQFLRLHLAPNTDALLPILQMASVLTIPTSQIVPIPHMPPWVMGIYNWRGEILWIVDLGHLAGLSPWYEQTTNTSIHRAVVLKVQDTNVATQVKSQMLGLVVNQVEDVEWCNVEMIQTLPLSNVAPEFARLLRGYWWKSDDDMLAILNGIAILKAVSG